MKPIHSLLQRQIRLHVRGQDTVALEWKEFIQAVNEAYHEFDADRDILERSLELSSQELLEASSHMQAVFHAFPDLFFWLDERNAILDYKGNGMAQLFPGITDFIGRNIQDIPLRSPRTRIVEALDKVRRTKALVSIEYALPVGRADLFFEARLLPLPSHKIIVIVRDITEQKQAESSLRESEERFRAIFETAQDSIFIKDRHLRYIHVNSAMEKLFRLTAAQFLGRSDADLFGAEFGKHIGAVDARVLAGEIMNEEYSYPIRGVPITFNVVKVPMRDSEGRVVGLCGIARDVTERKRAGDALRESEQRLADVIEFLPDATFVIDREGKVIVWNRAVEEMTGIAAEDILRKGDHEYAIPFYGERRPILIDLVLTPRKEFEEKHYTPT